MKKFRLQTWHVHAAFMISLLGLTGMWGAEKYLSHTAMTCAIILVLSMAMATINCLYTDLEHSASLLAKEAQAVKTLRNENAALRAQNENRHSIPPEVKGAMSILGITVCPFSRGEVIQAHRMLIARTHPDYHGANPVAARVNGARDALLRFLNLREHGKVADV